MLELTGSFYPMKAISDIDTDRKDIELAKKIRVALVISNLGFGGAERQVVELCRHIDRRRFDLYLISLSDHVPLAQDLGDKADWLRIIVKHSRFDMTVIPRLSMLLRRLGIDIVHGFLFDAEIASRLAGKMAGTKVIIASERNTWNDFGRIKTSVYRLTSHMVDLCIANSRAGEAFNRSLCGLPTSRYRVVYNSVDTRRFRPHSVEGLRQEIGLPEDACVVGMFGNFKRQKNHPMMLRAAARIADQMTHVHYLFVGDTLFSGHEGKAYRESIVEMVDEWGLASRCHFVGHREDVERFYNLCDLTVLPSFYEGMPNALLESMACGVPVIATDVADNRLIIPDGEVGFLIPSDDDAMLAERLQALATDATLRARMGRQAREWVESRFSPQVMAEAMANVYEESVRKWHDDQ